MLEFAPVLLVEDDETTLQFLGGVFRYCGVADPDVAVSRAEALERITSEDYAMIVLDLAIGADAVLLLDDLRAKGCLANVVVIHPQQDERPAANLDGVFAVMEKPLPLDQLTLVIRRCLAGSRAGAEASGSAENTA
ncbi:MAG: hypothetical protein WBX15_09110 [Thermoanaerobaculia bacterium]